MELESVRNSYFNGFSEIYNIKRNDWKTNLRALGKIASYFTVVIPAGIEIAYRLSLCGRVSKKPEASADDARAAQAARSVLPLTPAQPAGPPPEIIQTPESVKVRAYSGDLTAEEQMKMKAEFNGDKELQISCPGAPEGFAFTVRRQDLFESGAQVIVNAANTHLGGGGGIDGAIHLRGGNLYRDAHRELANKYKEAYVSGHAAMITSGNLKKAEKPIDNVIVVVGPDRRGDRAPVTVEQKANLYSCYYNSLVLAHSQGKTSIAFPSISTGIFNFPKDAAASISLKAVRDFIRDYPDTALKTVSIHFSPDDIPQYLVNYQKAATPPSPAGKAASEGSA